MTEGLVLPLDRAGIEAIIPHRDPFLLVDEIVELVPGESATGRYHVRDDAWYLRGHFPGRPIMPGVLQVEALAQVGAVCGLSSPGFAGRLARASTMSASSGSWCRGTRSRCAARSRGCAAPSARPTPPRRWETIWPAAPRSRSR